MYSHKHLWKIPHNRLKNGRMGIELKRMNTVFHGNKSRLFSAGAANMIYAAYCRSALHNLGAATRCSEFMLNLNGEADIWHWDPRARSNPAVKRKIGVWGILYNELQ